MIFPILSTKIYKKVLLAAILVAGCIFYSLYFVVHDSSTYSGNILFEGIAFNNSLSALLTPTELFSSSDKDSKSLKQVANSLYKLLSNPKLSNLNWKLTNKLLKNKLDSSKQGSYIKYFLEKRNDQHFYDPRITSTVYLNYLKEQYNKEKNTIPFSWEDWLDFSSLNKFLGNEAFSCQEFLLNYKFELDFELDENTTMETINDYTKCVSKKNYMKTETAKFRSEKLLPEFIFTENYEKNSHFLGKAYNAKLYMLTSAPKPDTLIFLADNGQHYEASTKQSSSMIKNGLLKSYMSEDYFTGFDPYKELKSLSAKYISHNKQDFANILNEKNDFTYDIPDSRFILEPLIQFKELFDTDDTLLKENEVNFKNTLRTSLQMKPNTIPKYFKEARILGFQNHNGHPVQENGAHYDFRFFSGFITEIPDSELSPHSPETLLKVSSNEKINSVASHFGVKNSILSHLSHMLLTLTFHDGLILFPAHGTLLAWYFNSLSFPWDEDGDVQMPIEDLAEFCLRYNNSLIVENPKFGFSKAFVDCATSITHRNKGNGSNNIDARIIDVDSGLYIDITGLSVSDDTMNQNNFNKIKPWVPDTLHHEYLTTDHPDSSNKNVDERQIDKKMIYEQHKANRIYNCRNKHYYSYDQLSPLRLTLFEGAQTFVAANDLALKSQLEDEYSSQSLTNVVFEKYYFSKYLRTWLSAYDILQAELGLGFNPQPDKDVNEMMLKKDIQGIDIIYEYYTHPTEVFSELVRESLFDITLDTSVAGKQLYRPKINLIEEIYHNRELAHAHTNEMRIFFPNWDLANKNIKDNVKLPTDWKRLGKWMLKDHPPPRIPLFDYLYYAEASENQLDTL